MTADGAQAMSLTVIVPSMLRQYAAGVGELSLSARTVREALEQLEREHLSLYRCVCDETGLVRRHVNLFVNSDHVRDLSGVDTALRPGDLLFILPSVSGG